MAPPRSARKTYQLATHIFVDSNGRDLGGYIADALKAVAERMKLPLNNTVD